MLNSWRTVSPFLVLVVVILLGSFASVTQTAAPERTEQADLATPRKQQAADKATPEPRNKSVLDDDVLNNPLSYLQDAFTSEEEDADRSEKSGKLVITLKALVATLLSTVI